MPPIDPQAVHLLTQINLQDALTSFGLEKVKFGRSLLEWPLLGSAEKFAHQVLEFDRDVANCGLREGSSLFLQHLSISLVTQGAENIPSAGPVLILSNHPGMADTLALFAGLPRSDVRIVAAERPFLKALKAVEPYLIYVPDQPEARLGVLRSTAAHLRANGAILTFPAGEIEPDPAVLEGAVESLASWSSSIGLFVRLMPSAQIVPAIVSGVLAPQATFHPLTWLRRRPKDRQRLGATLQLIAMILTPTLWPVTIQVRFAPAIPAADLACLRDPDLITRRFTSLIRPFWQATVRSDFQEHWIVKRKT
ncbi:MAG TPA: 1-acyl-sn-glycerol-3-phosphate acyltransferase [Anaerolineaceae bacterium]|nr:1-acyl-sn-glycerol-3-phosphate acyltransferase [Anaerolineaceae bacterium]